MDGACVSCFAIINAKWPHIFCYVCPTHGLDLLLKNVCSDAAQIGLRGDLDKYPWGETLFHDVLKKIRAVSVYFRNHGTPRKCYFDEVKNQVPAPRGTALVLAGDTRFASNFKMAERIIEIWASLQSAITSQKFKVYEAKLDNKTRNESKLAELKVPRVCSRRCCAAPRAPLSTLPRPVALRRD